MTAGLSGHGGARRVARGAPAAPAPASYRPRASARPPLVTAQAPSGPNVCRRSPGLYRVARPSVVAVSASHSPARSRPFLGGSLDPGAASATPARTTTQVAVSRHMGLL